MLNNKTEIKSRKEALDMLNFAIHEGGMDRLLELLESYSSDVALAETQDERTIAGNSAMKITLAIPMIEDTLIQTQAMAVWNIASRIAIGFNEMYQEDNDSEANGVLEKLIQLDPDKLERFPLSRFCKSFQKWAIDTEEAMKLALDKEYSVAVYNALDDRETDPDRVVCLVVCRMLVEPEIGNHQFKMLLPMSCIKDEKHFVEGHLDTVNEKVGAFIVQCMNA